MYERRTDKLLPVHRFLGRVAKTVCFAFLLIVVALAIGVLGYHEFANLPWLDSFLNASMILTGMGPVDPMKTDAAKLFASLYAIFSGSVFLTAIAFVLAPVFHRLLHHFHLDDEAEE
jgi:hypothetical protein